MTVTDNSGPRVDVPAYFQDADSTVVSSTKTDIAGTASATMGPGGYVTVVLPSGPLAFGGVTLQYQVYTWAAAKPGDHLVLDHRFANGSPSNVTFTLPIDTQHIFSSYYIASTCGSGNSNGAAGSSQSTVVITASFADCANNTADVLVYATSSSGAVVSSFSVLGQAIVDQSAVDYTGMAYLAPVTRDLELTNNDQPTADIVVTDHVATARGELYSTGITLSHEATAIGQPVLPVLPTGAVERLELRQSVNHTVRTFSEVVPASAFSRDWSTVRIPDFDPAVTPDLDTGTHVVTWANTAPGATTPDFSITGVHGGRALAGAMYLSYGWFIAGPATTSSLRFPELPIDVQDFNVQATDAHSLLGLVQAHVPGGYDVFRATIFQASAPSVPAGQVSTVGYAFNLGLLGRLRANMQTARTPNELRPFLLHSHP